MLANKTGNDGRRSKIGDTSIWPETREGGDACRSHSMNIQPMTAEDPAPAL